MAEKNLNDRILEALAGRDPMRVENAVGPGTPDIEYIGGWIESKQLPDYPKKAKTVVRVDHYVRGQRGWHMRRRAAGGRVHVVIEVARDVYVFDAYAAAQHLGIDWTRRDMVEHAAVVMSPWDYATFRGFITRCDIDRSL